MIKDRAVTSHTYNEETAEFILTDVCELYVTEFRQLQECLERLEGED